MNEGLMLFFFVGILIFFFAAGVPVVFSLGLTTLALMLLGIGIGVNPELIALRLFGGLNSFVLLAVPFFMFAGKLMNTGGMTMRIFDFANALVGRFKGGLCHVNILASVIFAGMSGSATADAAGLGAIEYKAMKENGYPDEITLGITAASSTVGPIIPPSIPLVFYAILANVSVGGILLAGVLPGIIIAALLMAFTIYYAQIYNYPRTHKSSLKDIFQVLKKGFLSLGAPLIIIGGIYTGFFTPTEAAAIAVVYALVIGMAVYKELTLSELWKITKQSMIDSAVVLVLIAVANAYGFMIVRSNLPTFFVSKVIGITESPILILLIVNAILLVIGMFLDNLVAISILTPILLPLVTRVGISPMHFGVIIVFNLVVGLITPPYGNVLFVLNKSTGAPLITIVKGCMLYYLPLLISLLLITFIPFLSTWLPALMRGPM